jgi:hypothetical protein
MNATATAPLLEVEPETFRRDFDRRCFDFGHRLSDDPLFEPEAILRLAKSLATNPDDVYYDAGDVRIDERWDEVPPSQLPVHELLDRIEHANAWIVLRKADNDPAYATLLDRCLDEIERYSGHDLRHAVKLRNAIIFVNSPHRISSYHIDRECNFLFQIRGTKTISIFDREDREVLPEREIERFWTTDNNAAVYKPHLQDRATVYQLEPGRAVHIPVNAPHWVQNGPQVSVSLSVNFHYRDEHLADVYRANYWLRRLGFDPTPPRRSAAADGIKRVLYGSARTLRHSALRIAGKSHVTQRPVS